MIICLKVLKLVWHHTMTLDVKPIQINTTAMSWLLIVTPIQVDAMSGYFDVIPLQGNVIPIRSDDLTFHFEN